MSKSHPHVITRLIFETIVFVHFPDDLLDERLNFLLKNGVALKSGHGVPILITAAEQILKLLCGEVVALFGRHLAGEHHRHHGQAVQHPEQAHLLVRELEVAPGDGVGRAVGRRVERLQVRAQKQRFVRRPEVVARAQVQKVQQVRHLRRQAHRLHVDQTHALRLLILVARAEHDVVDPEIAVANHVHVPKKSKA